MKTMENALKTTSGKWKKGIDYFNYALYAFGGLGMEMLYAFLLEPMLYGCEMEQWCLWQKLTHWTFTCITWLAFAFLIYKNAKKTLSFDLFEKKESMTLWQWLLGLAGVVLSLYCSYSERGEWKLLREYRKLGNIQIVAQYIYYLCETVLFLLIIVFAQEALEKWTDSNKKIPFGGIICGLTWGLAHIFTKGSLVLGLQGVALSTLMGSIYLITNKDVKKAYIFLFLMFAF